jgi:hypothetical protein
MNGMETQKESREESFTIASSDFIAPVYSYRETPVDKIISLFSH